MSFNITVQKLAKIAQAYNICTDRHARKEREAKRIGYTPDGSLSFCRAERKAKKRALARYTHLKMLFDAQNVQDTKENREARSLYP